ncbi:MAG: type II toxin-antitoxin system Phd/YefM family antitoxin [Myxococcota bacterium]
MWANAWPLQRAKAQFSELVRTARRQGPQYVTVHGREEVVVIDAAEYRRMTSHQTGAALLEAMQTCPHPDVELEQPGVPMPVSEAPEL